MKKYLRAVIEDREGKIYVESTSLYVVPRYAVTRDTCDPAVKNFVATSSSTHTDTTAASAQSSTTAEGGGTVDPAEIEKAKAEWMRTHQKRRQRRG